jgi:hypothetical protein
LVAKYALGPNRPAVIRPYIAEEVAGIDLSVNTVTKIVGTKTSAAHKIRRNNMMLGRIFDRQPDRQIR